MGRHHSRHDGHDQVVSAGPDATGPARRAATQYFSYAGARFRYFATSLLQSAGNSIFFVTKSAPPMLVPHASPRNAPGPPATTILRRSGLGTTATGSMALGGTISGVV